MGNDGKNHITGNKNRTMIGRIIKQKKGISDKNFRSFETVPNSLFRSVRAVGTDFSLTEKGTGVSECFFFCLQQFTTF